MKGSGRNRIIKDKCTDSSYEFQVSNEVECGMMIALMDL